MQPSMVLGVLGPDVHTDGPGLLRIAHGVSKKE
jgi:hypothetical protein